MEFRSLAAPVMAAIAVMLVGAAIHARLTDRFGMIQSERLEQFTANLKNVPGSFGAWQGVESDVDPAQLKRAQVTGHVSRTFRHQATGQVVNMFLVAGTSRHITLHTPDLCYQAAGFVMEGQPRSREVEAGLEQPVELAVGRFYREESEGRISQLQIFWAFSHDGVWHGPRWARSSLAGKGAMYKIYLIAPESGSGDDTSADCPAIAFVRQAMPQLQRALFPGGTTATQR